MGRKAKALVEEARVQQVAALEHAARALRIDDLGAVDGRQRDEARQVGNERQRHERSRGEARPRRDLVESARAIRLEPGKPGLREHHR